MTSIQASIVLRHIRKVAAVQSPDELSDRQLLERFAADKSEAAFAMLVRRHGPMVLNVCRSVLHHLHDAEDAFQATFLVLARAAGSIQRRESLGSWLYKVAYRLAVKARAKASRRRDCERRAEAMPAADPLLDMTWREVRVLLYEELKRLPEKYRAPLVHCYLEGKSQEEAARQLGWTKSTLRGRLDRGREHLRRRLSRRGLALSAGLVTVVLAQNPAAAAVPGVLLDSTVKAALRYAAGQGMAAGVVSAQAAALAQGVTQTMFLSKFKLALWFLVVSAVAGGVGLLTRHALAVGMAEPPPPEATAVQLPVPKPPPPASPSEAKDGVVVHGQVLDPDGKPFMGAKLSLWTGAAKDKAGPTVRATAGPDGRFRFRTPKEDTDGTVYLTASALGYGPAWIRLYKGSVPTLRLAKDDLPISGRILDLEGKPVAGVTVRILRLGKRAAGEDLKPWIENNLTLRKRGQYLNEGGLNTVPAAALGVPTSAKTGADGRFHLTGFGQERVLRLTIDGPTIEHGDLWAMTHPGPALGLIRGSWGLYGATFDYLAAPSRPIVGTVREKGTGKPVAGIRVQSVMHGDSEIVVTDAQGHYRLNAGKRKEYTVVAEGTPYFNYTKINIPDNPGFEPLTVDFAMDRGIELRVRVSDKATGKPVRGDVSYHARADNPYLKEFPSVAGLLHIYLSESGGAAPDGMYKVLAIPGPGWIIVQAENASRYVPVDMGPAWDGFLLRLASGGGFHPSQFQAVIPLDLPAKDPKRTNYDVVLEPGQIRTGTVIGPDGQPVAGAHAAGLKPVPEMHAYRNVQSKPLPGASFTTLGLDPRRQRALVFFHRDKKLGKVARVRGDEPGPLTVCLEPLGATTGRLLDAEGRPWAGLTVKAELTRKIVEYRDLPWELIDQFGPITAVTRTTDAQGRFRLDGLLPGLKYNLVFSDGAELKPGTIVPYHYEDLTVESGKTRDVGALKSTLIPGK
jgi:RNA polymerase sigma factor (sigma-70 family)